MAEGRVAPLARLGKLPAQELGLALELVERSRPPGAAEQVAPSDRNQMEQRPSRRSEERFERASFSCREDFGGQWPLTEPGLQKSRFL